METMIKIMRRVTGIFESLISLLPASSSNRALLLVVFVVAMGPILWFTTWNSYVSLTGGAERAVHPQQAQPAEEVVVTGSRLPSAVRNQTAPFWNAWIEPFGTKPMFQPEANVTAGQDAALYVELSAVRYLEEHVASKAVSSRLGDLLTTSSKKQLFLDVLLVPDTRYFKQISAAERVQTLTVKLDRLRQWINEQHKPPDSAFTALREADGDAPFSLGRVAFHLRTRLRSGDTSVALSFWVHGPRGSMPIDEMVVPICITGPENQTCKGAPEPVDGFAGPGVNGAVTLLNPPDVALHFVELNPSTIVGVLHCNTCKGWDADKFDTWELGRSADELRDYLSRTTLPAFERYAQLGDMNSFARNGESLYHLLFRNNSRPGQKTEAEREFERLVAEASAHSDEPNRTAPRLFVRMLPLQPMNDTFLPISMMAVPVPGKGLQFVGFDFSVETPLEFQDYTPTATCLNRWVLLVPPEKTVVDNWAIGPARRAFEQWISRIQAVEGQDVARQLSPTRYRAQVFQGINPFFDWIAPQSQRTEGKPANLVLTILSHHSNNELYFNDRTETPAIDAEAFTRQFATPSVAILDACGTGEPTTQEIVRTLNYLGVSTMIVTNTAVEADMGGKFLALFMKELNTHAGIHGYTIGQARFDAVKALSREPEGAPYGARALAFSLAGNANLELCLP